MTDTVIVTTEQLIYIVVAGLFGTLLGFVSWILRSTISDLRKVESQISNLPLNYVMKPDYHRDMDELKDMLRRVLEKLDEKADKR